MALWFLRAQLVSLRYASPCGNPVLVDHANVLRPARSVHDGRDMLENARPLRSRDGRKSHKDGAFHREEQDLPLRSETVSLTPFLPV